MGSERGRAEGVHAGDVKTGVADLLNAVRKEPTRMPLAELAALQASGMDVSIDLAGTDEPIAFVSPRRDERLADLSKREREVANLAAAGFSNAQIASALFISVATVKDHMHAIFSRTGFTSRSQLIAAWYGGLPTSS